jgi:hypothetical protein
MPRLSLFRSDSPLYFTLSERQYASVLKQSNTSGIPSAGAIPIQLTGSQCRFTLWLLVDGAFDTQHCSHKNDRHFRSAMTRIYPESCAAFCSSERLHIDDNLTPPVDRRCSRLPCNDELDSCELTASSLSPKSAESVVVESIRAPDRDLIRRLATVLCLAFRCGTRWKEFTSGLSLWRACSWTAEQVRSSKEEDTMSQSRGAVSFEPLFTAEDIGLRKEANVEHVMKVFVTIGEGLASRWIEMPKGVLLLQTVPDDPASGAIYLYDRELQVFYFVVFDEGRDDSLTAAEFDELVTEYNLVSWTAHPALLRRAVGRPGTA